MPAAVIPETMDEIGNFALMRLVFDNLEGKWRGGHAWRLISSAFMIVVGLCPGLLPGQEISREYPLKAAFLYNFGSYVNWPSNAFDSDRSPVVVGVVGPNPFGTTLDTIAANKEIRGRAIVVKYSISARDLEKCHILFVSANADEAQKTAAIDSTRSSNVLVVGETPGFAARGAVVNFYVEENKVRFEINLDAARERQLKISSKLLTLAKVIDPDHLGQLAHP